ncbi:hypothetical protein [Alicyclobacillus vulcanalis]|uniref:Uncharacterized protein n=1 Tax=Alicyclobacillus vulcanalis TaxID=252246 RepID=A0A1N7L135_9BACL|nr:hypothetical protein [Alicyclobacillus vulcanalis]SIS67360.1 hypothetical protein SAMN05421799_102323 [Alicyclobacillus vulcanalis]
MRMWLIAASSILALLFPLSEQTGGSPAVKKVTAQKVQIPPATEIQQVYIIAGLAARWFAPNREADVVSEIATWLSRAQPVAFQVPQPETRIVTNANIGPAELVVRLSAGEEMTIQPAFYVSGAGHALSEVIHDVPGVISYRVGHQTLYFRDPELYQWLKSNEWESQFHTEDLRSPS